MFIRQLFDSVSCTYTYLVATDVGGAALIIDPVDTKLDVYQMLIEQLDLTLLYAIDTHVHADHISAIGLLRDLYHCDTVHGSESLAKGVTKFVSHGDVLNLGKYSFDVIHTPGHTIESYCFLLRANEQLFLFSGDTLLIRATGRTDFQQGCSFRQYQSLFEKILSLPDSTVVYPGHDYNGISYSTIGEERAYNPRLQVKNDAEYAHLMGELNLVKPKLLELAVCENLDL